MIYPTRFAVLAAAAAVPLALLIAILIPGRWYAGVAAPVAVLLLTGADALVLLRRGKPGMRLSLPPNVFVGESFVADTVVTPAGPLRRAELAIEADALLALDDDGRVALDLSGAAAPVMAGVPITAVRRGTARVTRLWLRWPGPLGLAWRQLMAGSDLSVAVLPDLRPVRQRGAQLFQRHALQGLIAQLERGDGSEFESLVEFRSGMDRRTIDWKQSARHARLDAKQFRTEHNSQIVFAVDCGRQMSEPVDGLPRVDRVVSAMLLAAWVALKLGDRVALSAFDSRPRIASGFVSGAGAFAELQRLAAGIDYSGEETNYSFALTTLGARLTRRSMIVLFTEFPDLTSAEFLVRAAGRLAETHLLLVVVLRDEELEGIADRVPDSADDVTRAVTAAALLRDRTVVLTRLRHMGAHVIESPHDEVGERLVAGYVDLKRRNLL